MKNLFVVLALLPFLSLADTETVDGMEWFYTVSGGGATVTGAARGVAGAIVVPSSLGGNPVTGIGEDAFEWRDRLTSVTIPSGVTNIGSSAFSYCSSLRSVVIPSSVTQIGDLAFYCCASLESVVIPPTLTDIDRLAFTGCWALADKDGFVTVNGILFGYTGTSRSVTIPSDVTRIDDSALAYHNEISEVMIPPGVTRIGEAAFSDCGNLYSLTIPSSVTNIGGGILDGTRLLGSYDDGLVIVDNCLVQVKGGCHGDVAIPGNVRLIADYAFANDKGLTSVTIPPAVRSIGANSFANCKGLRTVTICEGVISIGVAAFNFCTVLQSLTIPSSVTGIGAYAFVGCSSLGEVHVSNSGDIAALKFLLYMSGGFPNIGTAVFDHVDAPDCSCCDYEYDGRGRGPGAGAVMPFVSAAAVYDGSLQQGGRLVGTIQVKVAKGRIDKKTGVFSAKVTATVQLADGSKKITFKNGVADAAGNVTGLTAAGCEIDVSLGVNGLGGTFRRAGDSAPYQVDGTRNVFSAKDADSKATAAAIEKMWIGAINVVGDGVVLSVTVAKKGKVKVSGMVDGVKVSAKSQLLVGATDCCIPVVITKKANLAFNLWLRADGTVEVHGADSVTSGRETASPFWEAGKAGALRSGAAFRMDGAAIEALKKVLPGLLTDYLPGGLPVAQNGTKWVVAGGAKAGKLKLVKGTTEIDREKSKFTDNMSGLKLTYKAKDGSFKGSFNAYALENGKIKSVSAKVTGVVVNGNGYGQVVVKKAKIGELTVR